MLDSYRTLTDYRKDPLQFFINCYKKHGPTTHLKIFGKEMLIVSRPEDVMYVLKNNHGSYSKGRTTKALAEFLGTGLITNDDMTKWRKQHRMVRPMMNPKGIHELAPKILRTVQEFIPELDREEVNAFREMNRLTWRIILRTLFTQESSPAMDEWLEEILELMQTVVHKTRSLIPIPFWVPTARHRRMKEIITKFDTYVYRMIQDRREGEKKDDLIQLLIDTNGEMTEREIRDEVMTFLMAGHETITNTMTWALIELARHPEFKDQLEQEAKDFLESKDFEALGKSPWLSAFLDEVLRMWPAVWVFMRQAEKDDVVSGVKVPVGANVILATYLSHHSPDLWEEPEAFNPRRFLDKKTVPGAFYPFGQGPRACIGAYFAQIEAKIILSVLLTNFDWTIKTPEPQKSTAEITLRPANNLIMRFRRKHASPKA